MIKEDYVSFEVAKLLQNKGFNEQTRFCFRRDGKILHNDESYIGYPGYYPRPTLQMVMKWLREEHNIDILITIGGFIEKGKVYFCSVYKNLINYGDLKECSTYEEACEEGIKHCLNNII